MKNREAAFLSRQRRKQHLQHLESRVSALQKENEELKKKVSLLEKKNMELTSKLQGGAAGKKAGMKTAGAVLMVVFVSFAVFLNPVSVSRTSSDMFSSENSLRLDYFPVTSKKKKNKNKSRAHEFTPSLK